MAKRKRLTPAQSFLAAPEALPAARPPIAQVAGEAAALSALSDLEREWQDARESGRMVLSLDIHTVRADHLVRDRVALEPEALETLKASLRARGQQTPVEVVALGPGAYGLISGWRRLMALRQLHDETGEARFATVQALLRRPADLPAAYVAMVEENEIRADLSHYERARIVARALEQGVFATEKQALHGLFAAVSYAKRSKIKSLLPVVAALDGALRFPGQMTERLGLRLARALAEDPGLGAVLRAALDAADPQSAEAEAACLVQALAPAAKPAPEPEPEPAPITLRKGRGRVELSGPGVTADFLAALESWLRARQ
jgi:ParB family chromosome partitioning protein